MKRMTFDFVSDVSCPWCVIGLRGLEIALERADDLVQPQIRFHPFELNPDMQPGGENVLEHISRKYGSSPEQVRENRAGMKERAAALGFVMNSSDESRIWNTFDAHRLLHWAGLEGGQVALKHALFEAYFTRQQSPADHEVLVQAATIAGLDPKIAREVLSSDRYVEDVRLEERRWLTQGVRGVPHIVINDAYVVSGGQPPAEFERTIRHIAAQD
jgi:predicted DsbA family dithiol-disulfide isomerase